MSYKINYSTEEKIKLAKDDSVEKLYESKKNQRTVRVLTVLAYVLTVSMAAIILSTYYVFFWNPKNVNLIANSQAKPNCGSFCQFFVSCKNLLVFPDLNFFRFILEIEAKIQIKFERYYQTFA